MLGNLVPVVPKPRSAIKPVFDEDLPLSGGSFFFAKDGFSLSVFAYGDNVEGVCERGVKYPVENVALTSSFPLGVSNEIIADEAEISLSKGLLLIILSKFN